MKNRNSMILLLTLAMLFVACGKNKTEPGQGKKSVLIKSQEEIQDENDLSSYYDLVDKANGNLEDEDKIFIAELLKYIEDKDTDKLAKILKDPLKGEVGGDLRVLSRKLEPLDLAGPMEKIKKIEKKDDTLLVIIECENDSLALIAGKDKDGLTSLDLRLGKTIAKNKKLKKDNQDFIDRSYKIIDALTNDNKGLFEEYSKGLGLDGEKFDEMYEGLRSDLEMAGRPLTNKSKVKVSFANDKIKNAPSDQNLVDVTLVFTFENIEKIVYDFIYTEDMNLISIEVRPDEK